MEGFAFDSFEINDTANSNMKVKKRYCRFKNFPFDQKPNNIPEYSDDNFTFTLHEIFKDLKT